MAATTKHSREDEVDDHFERKKRRVLMTPSKSAEKQPANEKVDPKMVGKILFNAEESEILQRGAAEDVAMHKEVMDELQSVMSRIKIIKKSNDVGEEEKKEEIEQIKAGGVLQFVSLKKLNRLGHFRCKKIREVTLEAKQKVDQQHLSLQNLLYELMHLQREISKCIQFKSMDEEISLMSQDEFLQLAPKEITEPLLKENDPHKLMLARLDWELRERKALSAKYEESSKTKETIQKETEKLKMNLKSLNPLLGTILESTKPVQEHLEMPFDENLKKQKIANHLPAPLYFLFVQASSYAQACDKEVSVEITGDVELAHSFEKMDSPIEEESDSEDESEKKDHRRTTIDSKLTKKQEQLLKKHPLAVKLTLTPQGKGLVTLSFHYFINLEFVTVSPEIQLGTSNKNIDNSITKINMNSTTTTNNNIENDPNDSHATMASSLFDPVSILRCLYEEGDDGDETPNPENVFKLAKFEIADLASHLKDTGRPYRWVQRLCGLQNLMPSNNPSAEEGQTRKRASNMEQLIKLVKKRLSDRLDLFRQLSVLDDVNSKPSATWFSSYNFSNVPRKVSSQLVQWKTSTHEEFMKRSFTKNIIECELATPNDFFYYGKIERTPSINTSQLDGKESSDSPLEDKKAIMTFYVVINPDYPQSLPLFCIKVSWKNIERSAFNDEPLRELESSINLRASNDLDIKNTLLNQVAMLCSCFDVYLETGGLNNYINPQQPINLFEMDRSYPRLTRGPTRSKPYKFIPKLGTFGHY